MHTFNHLANLLVGCLAILGQLERGQIQKQAKERRSATYHCGVGHFMDEFNVVVKL